ncbi:hypothetical protein [Paenibacillus daejeonensis]|uniref:hypothetical protein n=1 Tax=Paenibacillus daejeonensis TaxID=135193 RepID=UPI0003698F1D|nr:hypothetical protein [Paenibacillus daejeonensis]
MQYKGKNRKRAERLDQQPNQERVEDIKEYKIRESHPLSRGNSKLKHQFIIGVVALVLIGFGFFGSPSSPTLSDVQADGIGKGMKAGVRLVLDDVDFTLAARDYEIEMKPDTETTRALIWDSAAEDGDVVTVKVNGNVLADKIHLLNKPVPLDIPVPSVVEIVGVKDGYGGITYAVKFSNNSLDQTYFNVAPEGSSNTYTLNLP